MKTTKRTTAMPSTHSRQKAFHAPNLSRVSMVMTDLRKLKTAMESLVSKTKRRNKKRKWMKSNRVARTS